MKKIVCCFLLFVIFSIFKADLLTAENEWKKLKTVNGVEIIHRDVEGSSLDEIKAFYTINAPIENVFSLVKNGNVHKRWIAITSESSVFKTIDDEHQIVYYELNLPFPLSKRYLVTKLENYANWETGETITTIKSIDPEECKKCPEDIFRKDMPRAKELNYTVTLNRLNSDQTKVTFQAHGELGIDFPDFIKKQLICVQPYLTMKKLAKQSCK